MKGSKKNNQNFARNADIILLKHFSWKCHKQDYQLRKINKEQFDRHWPKDCNQDWDHNMQTTQTPTLSDQQQLEVAVVTFKFQDNKVHRQHGLDAKSESTYGKDQLWLKAAQIPNVFFLSFSHTDGFEVA